MASRAAALEGNAPGDFFVDSSCIDCDTCRQIAPETFRSEADQTVVFCQPRSKAERERAGMALVACPTSSIGTSDKAAAREAVDRFPERIAEDVHYCGFAAEASFGASSYWFENGGEPVMVDCPRASKPLFERLSRMGGVRTMFLTHRDDVADHASFHREFGCTRILHRRDAGGLPPMDQSLEGDEPIRLSSNLLAIPVPGHTRGSAALLYKEMYLFAGDHLWYSADHGRLHASRSVCWHSWKEQTRSMEKLLDYRFEWVLPGHGRRYRAASAAAMRQEIERLCRWMRP